LVVTVVWQETDWPANHRRRVPTRDDVRANDGAVLRQALVGYLRGSRIAGAEVLT
jgi:hypothetical protein